jgi:hypothetical protein
MLSRMDSSPIQIRNPIVVRAIRDLAKLTGQPITEAVGEAVRAALSKDEVSKRAEYERRLAAIQEISRQIRELPIVGPKLTDDDLYDEEGMPRRD